MCHRKLRSSQAGQLLLHLSLALLGVYVLFIVFLMAVKQEVVCAIAGGLLHYFLLVTFFLMAAEAVNLYAKLVVVLGVPDIIQNRYVLKAALISWRKSCNAANVIIDCLFPVVPMFIVILSEAPNWRNYIGEEL